MQVFTIATLLAFTVTTEVAAATARVTTGLIAVHTLRGDHVQAWMFRPDGTGLTRFPVYGELDFSPDGRRVVIAEGGVLRLADRYGADAMPLLRAPHNVFAPAWSPRGDLIYFDQHENGPFSVPLAGGEATRLDRGGSDTDVSSGGQIAYEVPGRNGPRVVVANADGSGRLDIGRGLRPRGLPTAPGSPSDVEHASALRRPTARSRRTSWSSRMSTPALSPATKTSSKP